MKLATRAVSIGITLAAGLALGGCGTPQVPVAFTCTQYQSQPTEFTPYCADAGQNFSKVSWSYWGTKFANGTGKALTNLCEPSCVAGKTDITDVDLTLDQPVKVGDRLVFSRLTIKYHTPVAGHKDNEKLDLVTAPMGE